MERTRSPGLSVFSLFSHNHEFLMASKQGPGPFSVIPDAAQTHALLNSPLEDFSSRQSGLLPGSVLSRHTLEGPPGFSHVHIPCAPLSFVGQPHTSLWPTGQDPGSSGCVWPGPTAPHSLTPADPHQAPRLPSNDVVKLITAFGHAAPASPCMADSYSAFQAQHKFLAGRSLFPEATRMSWMWVFFFF